MPFFSEQLMKGDDHPIMAYGAVTVPECPVFLLASQSSMHTTFFSTNDGHPYVFIYHANKAHLLRYSSDMWNYTKSLFFSTSIAYEMESKKSATLHLPSTLLAYHPQNHYFILKNPLSYHGNRFSIDIHVIEPPSFEKKRQHLHHTNLFIDESIEQIQECIPTPQGFYVLTTAHVYFVWIFDEHACFQKIRICKATKKTTKSMITYYAYTIHPLSYELVFVTSPTELLIVAPSTSSTIDEADPYHLSMKTVCLTTDHPKYQFPSPSPLDSLDSSKVHLMISHGYMAVLIVQQDILLFHLRNGRFLGTMMVPYDVTLHSKVNPVCIRMQNHSHISGLFSPYSLFTFFIQDWEDFLFPTKLDAPLKPQMYREIGLPARVATLHLRTLFEPVSEFLNPESDSASQFSMLSTKRRKMIQHIIPYLENPLLVWSTTKSLSEQSELADTMSSFFAILEGTDSPSALSTFHHITPLNSSLKEPMQESFSLYRSFESHLSQPSSSPKTPIKKSHDMPLMSIDPFLLMEKASSGDETLFELLQKHFKLQLSSLDQPEPFKIIPCPFSKSKPQSLSHVPFLLGSALSPSFGDDDDDVTAAEHDDYFFEALLECLIQSNQALTIISLFLAVPQFQSASYVRRALLHFHEHHVSLPPYSSTSMVPPPPFAISNVDFFFVLIQLYCWSDSYDDAILCCCLSNPSLIPVSSVLPMLLDDLLIPHIASFPPLVSYHLALHLLNFLILIPHLRSIDLALFDPLYDFLCSKMLLDYPSHSIIDHFLHGFPSNVLTSLLPKSFTFTLKDFLPFLQRRPLEKN